MFILRWVFVTVLFSDTICSQVFFGIGALATSAEKSLTFGCFQCVFFCQFLSRVKQNAEFQKHLNATNPSPERVLLFSLSVRK